MDGKSDNEQTTGTVVVTIDLVVLTAALQCHIIPAPIKVSAKLFVSY